MSAAVATQGLERPGTRWVNSPGWDAFWMFSALWGVPLLLVGSLVTNLAAFALALFAVNQLMSVFHSLSTTYMVLGSPLLKEERRLNRRKYFTIPLAIVLFCFALGLYVAVTQRFPEDGRLAAGMWPWMLYVGLFWVGHFWHFGNQDFGVLTIYRLKAGQTGLRDRKVDRLYASAMMFVIQPIVYVCFVKATAFAEVLHTFLPLGPTFLEAASASAVGAAGIFTVGVVAFELSKPNRSLPKLLYYVVMFLHPVLLYTSVVTQSYGLGALYVIAYLWSHWLIAISLVGRINTRYYQSRGDSQPVSLLKHVAILGFIVGVVSLLFYSFPTFHLLSIDSYRYKEVLASITPEMRLFVGALFGYFLAEQILHYYCDRSLFSLRDPGVRKNVAPLLL